LDGWIDRERYDLLVRRAGGEGDSCATPTDRHKITADSPTCAYVQGGPQKVVHTPYLWNRSIQYETDFTKMFPELLETKITLQF